MCVCFRSAWRACLRNAMRARVAVVNEVEVDGLYERRSIQMLVYRLTTFTRPYSFYPRIPAADVRRRFDLVTVVCIPDLPLCLLV